MKLGDIGLFLLDRIKQHFRAQQFEANLKYIDPSYLIRSIPADPADAVYCSMFGLNAVHAAMCSKARGVCCWAPGTGGWSMFRSAR